MLSAQTPCTEIEPFAFTVNTDGDWLDVGQPSPSGMLHRMAHSVTKVSCLTTDVTFPSQFGDSSWYQCQLSIFPSGGYPRMLAVLGNDGKMIPQFRG